MTDHPPGRPDLVTHASNHPTSASGGPTPTHSPPPSRRGLLAGAVGIVGLAVGAGGTVAGYQLTAQPSVAAGVISPSEDLMREHGILKRLLLIYQEASRRVAAGGPLPATAVHQAASIVRDYIEGFHEGLEEGYVFPRLQQAGRLLDTVQVLLVQHARGRRITARVIAATATRSRLGGNDARMVAAGLDTFTRMYEPHEAREDTVVFPAFRAITPLTTLTHLGERFADEQRRQFGPTGFTDTVERVAAIEHTLGINDLNHVTPPPP